MRVAMQASAISPAMGPLTKRRTYDDTSRSAASLGRW